MLSLPDFSLRRLALGFALCIFFASALTSHARDINVEDGCSRRDAIRAANENEAEDGCPAGGGPSDTIILKDHVKLSVQLPTITSDIVIAGNGRMVSFGDYPTFVVNDASLTLGNLHVRFRNLRTGDLLEITDGKLTLDNTVFHDCIGTINGKDSRIELLGNSIVCGHPHDIVKAWFGQFPEHGSGAECQRVDAVGVGNQSLVDAGFIDAIDIWSYLGPGVDICFP